MSIGPKLYITTWHEVCGAGAKCCVIFGSDFNSVLRHSACLPFSSPSFLFIFDTSVFASVVPAMDMQKLGIDNDSIASEK